MKHDPHWSGNRHLWWRTLATLGWLRGVVSFPGVPDYAGTAPWR